MKIAALLFSLMFIFLNAVPCCLETCDEGDGVEHREENGSADACSPFLSCGSCAGFVLQQEFIEISCFSAVFNPLDEQAEISFTSDYSIEIWQPPKKV